MKLFILVIERGHGAWYRAVMDREHQYAASVWQVANGHMKTQVFGKGEYVFATPVRGSKSRVVVK